MEQKPKSLLLGGRFPILCDLELYLCLLDAVQPPDMQINESQEMLRIFTDGSASESTTPPLRLCSRAVTKATLMCHQNEVLFSLPGRYHAVFWCDRGAGDTLKRAY